MMFSALLIKNILRRYYLYNTTSKLMQEYLSIPFVSNRKSINQVAIVSLDIETTGLNPETDQIVSIGLVEIDNMGIKLNSCWHQTIKTNKTLKENSVIIHHITNDESSAGVSIEQAITTLLKRIKGKVVLVHNKTLEQAFINRACQNLFKTGFVMPVIDTQFLAKRTFDRQGKTIKPNELRLFNLRKKFNMPSYKAHNALLDAIATAELFLAMAELIAPAGNARLADFL